MLCCFSTPCRTSVEDNVACAAREVVVSADVRAVCQRVGAHDTIMTLPVSLTAAIAGVVPRSH